MNSYNLGKIDSTTDIRGASRYGFNIIGVQGRPLVGFSFDTQDEAEAAPAESTRHRERFAPGIAKLRSYGDPVRLGGDQRGAVIKAPKWGLISFAALCAYRHCVDSIQCLRVALRA